MKAKSVLVFAALAFVAIVTGGQVGTNGGPTMTETPYIGEYGASLSTHNVAATFDFATSGTSSTANGQVSTATASTTGNHGDNQTTTGLTTGSTSSSTTGTTGNGPVTWNFFVANQGTGYNTNWTLGTDSRQGAQSLTRNVPIGPAVGGVFTYAASHGYQIDAGDAVSMSDTTLGANDVVTTWEEAEQYNTNTAQYTHWFWRTDYKQIKYPLGAASVDSRLVYGQPDLAGVYSAGANAPARNVCFNPWIFNGGLFVGNMPSTTPDESGTARVQLQSATTPVAAAAADLSFVYQGTPSTVTANLLTDVSTPSASDQNINQSQTTVTWSTAWSLATAYPVGAITLGSSVPTNQYSNVSITPGILSADYILSCDSESTFVANGGEAWQYIASPTYGPSISNPPWPLTDAQPRLWVLQSVYTKYWTYQDGNP